MSGHSKWATIKRSKEKEDGKKSKEFSKVAKEIVIVVRLTENGDPATNPTLYTLVNKAKSLNMTKEKIEKAISRGLGVRDDSEDVLLENTYEFYGPHGTTYLVDCETDNPNRTIAEIKLIGHKNGLKFASEGSVSWGYKTLGQIVIELKPNQDADEVMLTLMEIDGIVDIQKREDSTLNILVQREKQKDVYVKLNDYSIISARLVKVPDSYIDIQENNIEELAGIEDAISELQEVVDIWPNYENE